MAVGAGGEEGEHEQQAAAPRQGDEDVMCLRTAEEQRPFDVDQRIDRLMGSERLQPAGYGGGRREAGGWPG